MRINLHYLKYLEEFCFIICPLDVTIASHFPVCGLCSQRVGYGKRWFAGGVLVDWWLSRAVFLFLFFYCGVCVCECVFVNKPLCRGLMAWLSSDHTAWSLLIAYRVEFRRVEKVIRASCQTAASSEGPHHWSQVSVRPDITAGQ